VALRNILSAFGKLGVVALIAVAFAFGLLTTIYLSLRSPNIQVPEVVNQTYFDGEKTLSKAGLDIRERAKRYKPNVLPGVILDQSPHAGEVVKAGQTVAVVVSRAPKEGEKPPDEAVAEERREERGTEALDQNKNSNRRKNTNRNANGNLNANANANTNGNAASNSNANRREENTNTGNANLPGNRNANSARNTNGSTNANTNASRNRNSNSGAKNSNTSPRTTNSGGRPTGANANRRPTP
jgi:beta-lactam-binding protein with PASTA domain